MRMPMEYAKLFIKVSFSNKIGLVMMLAIPTIFMIYNNKDWISAPPSDEYLLRVVTTWWGYIIAMSILSGVGANLLILREQGFLKLFKFISGSTFPLFLGNVIAQFVFSSFSLFLFNVVVAILFQSSFITLFITSFVLLIIVIIPLSLYVAWIPSLSINQETITSLSALVIFPLLYVTSNTFNSDNMLSLLLLFNPLEFVQQVARVL